MAAGTGDELSAAWLDGAVVVDGDAGVCAGAVAPPGRVIGSLDRYAVAVIVA